MAMAPIKEFSELYPDWHIRFITPAGLRVMVMHDVFSPNDPVVRFFEALETDPQYVWMCKRQNCFRARVSPPPSEYCRRYRQKLNQGVWPVDKDLLAVRKFVDAYDTAENFASCHFIEEVGGSVNDTCETLRVAHDDYCKTDELD